MPKGQTRTQAEVAQEALDNAIARASKLEDRALKSHAETKSLHDQAVLARQLAVHAAQHPALQKVDPVTEAVAAVPEPPVQPPTKATAAEKKAAKEIASEVTGAEATNVTPLDPPTTTGGPGPGAALDDDADWFASPA